MRNGRTGGWLRAMALMGMLLALNMAARADELYARKATWAETMLAARERCLKEKAQAGGADFNKALTALWQQIERDFPLDAIRMQMDSGEQQLKWFRLAEGTELAGLQGKILAAARNGADESGGKNESNSRLTAKDFLDRYTAACEQRKLKADLDGKVNFRALRMAIEDLARTFPQKYANAPAFLKRAGELEARLPEIRAALSTGQPAGLPKVRDYLAAYTALQREALLANPLLDFDQLLLIKRKPVGNPYRSVDPDKGTGKYIGMPQQSSWQLHTIPTSFTLCWDNELDTLQIHKPEAPLQTLFKSPGRRLFSDIDLHFDGDRAMFSMPDDKHLWQLWELSLADRKLRQVSRGDQPDVHNLDGCYLPGGQIAYISTAPFQGVPCNAKVNVGMLYSMNADGSGVRQLCFDQDHNFCPVVTADGKIMYMRWEYADIPHVWARFLFTMNPDGTCQREVFGTGSYWPNGIWYARPIPGSPTKIVGIVTGHHVGRQGDLVVFDPAKSHDATEGAVQRIPGYGKKIDPIIQDKLTEKTFPKFLHPFPLSEKYFLVACRPSAEDLWGIYLVDIYDNMVPVRVDEGYALLEPIPLRKTPTPPVLASRVDLARKDALIYIEDIYKGRSLAGVPRGSIKSLRLYTYHFAYRTVAGIDHRVGADGPWEPKVILGTVPVEPDGSVFARVPANAPLTVQALDEKGRAIQTMRSWMTAMPGEILSCVGCHEQVNNAPPNLASGSLARKPVEIAPWRGPARGFSFVRDVQPVLDQYCVSCHDGKAKDRPDLRRDQGKYICYTGKTPEATVVQGPVTDKVFKKYGGIFYPSYLTLRALVRPAGIESDLRPLNPMEFDARTSELFQMLEKGHHGVKLGAEAWDRLTTWLDLNAPCHGTWQEVVGAQKIENDHRRRVEVKQLYGGLYDDPEQVPQEAADRAMQPVAPAPEQKVEAKPVELEGWPFGTEEARRRQGMAEVTRRTIDLGAGVKLDLALIPAGRFVMGSAEGADDEQPEAAIEIRKPFWMGVCEITNEQFGRFDPSHDSRYEHKGTWKFEQVDLGWPLNGPKQPVVRVSWRQAVEFCNWLSKQARVKASLPTEAQWEYACRAGSATPFFFGGLNDNFAPFANLADASLRELAWGLRGPMPPDLAPRDNHFNDGLIVTGEVGKYNPNPWGLCDMHGNAWEWTRSMYKPYPYAAGDGRDDTATPDTLMRVVRGGSWNDRPKRSTASFRLAYPAWQKVYNVGFRVIVEADAPQKLAAK